MTKYDGQGNLIETETKTITVFYGRKVGLPNYSNEEASLHVQVAVEPTDDTGEIETKLIEAFAFAKSTVYTQLGLGWELRSNNVVRDGALPEEAPKATPSTTPPSTSSTHPGAAPSSGSGASKDALWQDLFDNPNNWFDNRATAKGNQPQFKGKKTGPYNGHGLWLNSAPEWAKDALNGKVSA